jgi:mRNA-degrading endonuclease RelE of RelBE toxin-antitoxin system
MSKLTKDNIRFLPPAAKYLKKLKDKKLKKLYQDAIDSILDDPFHSPEKTGDLKGIRSYDIYYCNTNYELAYTIQYINNDESGKPEMIIIIMAGTRENFYDELKRYLR